jgi:aminobenzoyl-glutamate utilization protein B
MNTAAAKLREHLYYTYRMHYVIMEGGEAPNVVPDKASVWYFARNTDDRVEDMQARLIKCAEAGAHASETELSIRVLTAIHQSHRNASLTKLAHQNSMLVGIPEWTDEEIAFGEAIQNARGRTGHGFPTKLSPLREWDPDYTYTGGYSTDSAEVAWLTALVGVRIPTNSATGHHWTNVASVFDLHKSIIAAAKVHAGIAIDLLTKPELLKEVRDDQAENIKKWGPYKSYLPPDAEPPNDLNRELMEKWRPRLEPTHLEWPY